tara:strand:+ start:1250 stop:1825 length:576 start_codon:yes stop_codon:yes gene_type:complete
MSDIPLETKMSDLQLATEVSDMPIEPKRSKKQRRIYKNKIKLERLLGEIQDLTQKAEVLAQRNAQIIMQIKELIKLYPHEVRRLEDQTKLQLENLIKSGTRISKHRFDKPVKLSANLYSFLKVDDNMELTRIEVVRKISKYIRDKKLQLPSNRKLFNLDTGLKNIFNISENDTSTYTYNNINKFIHHHLDI